jgi:hypothetical protein
MYSNNNADFYYSSFIEDDASSVLQYFGPTSMPPPPSTYPTTQFDLMLANDGPLFPTTLYFTDDVSFTLASDDGPLFPTTKEVSFKLASDSSFPDLPSLIPLQDQATEPGLLFCDEPTQSSYYPLQPVTLACRSGPHTAITMGNSNVDYQPAPSTVRIINDQPRPRK